MILCLSKTPDGLKKELNGQQRGRSKDKQGWQAERITRRRKEEKEEQQENKGKRISGTSHPDSHGIRVKVRCTEIRIGKGPEAKGRRNNLRKASKKQAKLRPGINK